MANAQSYSKLSAAWNRWKVGYVMTRALPFLFYLFMVVAALMFESPARADYVLTTVAVGTTPEHLKLTPDGSKLFVSNTISNTVSIISTTTDAVVATVPTGMHPGPIRFTPNGAKAYVVNETSNNVSVIDVATFGVSTTVSVGTNPVTLSVTLDGTKVYVVNRGSNTVSVISTTTDTVTGSPISVGTGPNVIAKTPDGTKAYVANSTSSDVSVISTSSDSVVATISVLPSKDPGSIHFLPDGSKAYVANRGCVARVPPIAACPTSVGPTVSVINVGTNSVVKTINVGTVGAAPHAMRITPNGAKLYLVNKHGDEVKVIDTATDAVTTTIPLTSGSCTNIAFGVGSCPVRVDLTPDGSKAYVVEERPLGPNGVLTAICTGVVVALCGGASTDTVIGTLTLGNSPVDMEILGGSKAYVGNSGSSSVSVVAQAAQTQIFLTPAGRVAPETIVGFISGPAIPVDVRVKDVNYPTGLGDFQFTITFNPSVASVLTATPGTFLGSTGRPVSCTAAAIAAGSVSYRCDTLATTPNGPLGSGVLATITFQPGANFGSTSLTFATSHLDDITGGVPISHTPLTGAMLIGKCGDFNGDHAVTVGDILLMILRFGSNAGPPPTPNWDPRFDVNNDGRVNVADLVIEGQEFGRSCTAP